MGKFATGITVVTTPIDGDDVHGMTANAFMSVSLEPPLILVSIDRRAHTHRYIQEAKRFGVNFLHAGQTALSNHFAGKVSAEVSAALKYEWHDDIPLLADCSVQIACRLWANYDGGDHTLFVGEVAGMNVLGGEPLLYYSGAYHTLKPKA